MVISKKVYRDIMRTLGSLDAECGGVLAVDKDNVISDYFFDQRAGSGKKCYIPSRSVAEHIRDNWQKSGLDFCGIIHSHPLDTLCKPSNPDVEASLKIMTANEMDSILMAIVRGHELRMFRICNSDNVPYRETDIEIGN